MPLGSRMRYEYVCRRPRQQMRRSVSARVCWLTSQLRSQKPHQRQSLMTGTTAMSQSDISTQSRSGNLNDEAQQPSRAEQEYLECQRMNAEQERSALKRNTIWPQHSAAASCIAALPREAPVQRGIDPSPKLIRFCI